MKNLFLAAFAALGLTVAIVPLANAATAPAQTSAHQGPYDNSSNSMGGSWYVGGGG